MLDALLLVIVANSAPVAGRFLLGRYARWPLDGGRRFADGQPLFGPSKTLRGIVLAVVATALVAPMLSMAWRTGAAFGGTAMVGDLLSSFVKRRCRLAPHRSVPGLDQIPESLLPMLLFRDELHLDSIGLVQAVLVFILLDLLFSRLYGRRLKP